MTRPPPVESHSPTLVAPARGVVQTWWMGVLLGLPLAVHARVERPPQIAPAEPVRPLVIAIGATGLVAMIAGLVGMLIDAPLHPEIASVIEPSRHDRWPAAWFAHNASYLGGAVAGVSLWVWTLAIQFARSRRQRMALGPGPGVREDRGRASQLFGARFTTTHRLFHLRAPLLRLVVAQRTFRRTSPLSSVLSVDIGSPRLVNSARGSCSRGS